MSTERPSLSPKEKDPFLQRIFPMIPESISRLPLHLSQWTCEAKWNGMRAIIYAPSGEDVRILTRTGREVSTSFPEITKAFKEIAQNYELVVDGEIVYGEGKTMEEANRVIARSNTKELNAAIQSLLKPCLYVAFDILYLDGENLIPLPLEVRQQRLRETIPRKSGKTVQINHIRRGSLKSFVEALRASQYEGVILKRKGSLYKPGVKSRDWLKLKFTR